MTRAIRYEREAARQIGRLDPRPSPIPRPKNRDPLGRTNQGGGLNGDDVRVPEEAERQRTRAIQEELRRRGAELDYIDRLLRRF